MALETGFCSLRIVLHCLWAFCKTKPIHFELENKTCFDYIRGGITIICGLWLNPATVNVAVCTYGNPICFFAAAMAGCLGVLSFAMLAKEIKAGKFLAWIGRNSIVFLCGHLIIIRLVVMAVNVTFKKDWVIMESDLQWYTSALLSTAGFVLCCLIVAVKKVLKGRRS